MKITYKNKKIEILCTDSEAARKELGMEMAEKIRLRIYDISAYPTVEALIEKRIGRCHSLKQNRKGQYAMDLVHPYRLVFEKQGELIQIVKILEIVDYH